MPPPPPPVPDAPTNLLAVGGDGQVVLTWDAPEDDGGTAITDYQYQIDQTGEWISIGSTDTTHTVTGLTNGTAYVFQVRAVNAAGNSAPSNQTEATPELFYPGLCAFRQWGGHHLRPRIRECGHPADSARPRLLR